MSTTRTELEQYAKKLLREREATLHANTINQIVERDWRDYITYLAEQIEFGVSIADAHIALDAMADKFSSGIAKQWTEVRTAKPVEREDVLYREVPEPLREYTLPGGYLLTELTGGDLSRAIRMILAHYWREIVESGLTTFFMSHPEFGIESVDNKLYADFRTQIHSRYVDRRQALSYREGVLIPFELEMLTGLGGLPKVKQLIQHILYRGVSSDNFRNMLANEFDSFYYDQAYIRGSKYAGDDVMASDFVSEFCYWVLTNPPMPPLGSESPPRHYYK